MVAVLVKDKVHTAWYMVFVSRLVLFSSQITQSTAWGGGLTGASGSG